MLMSGIFGENLFDDWWGFPTRELERELSGMDKRLYGKNASHLMKTDVLHIKKQCVIIATENTIVK